MKSRGAPDDEKTDRAEQSRGTAEPLLYSVEEAAAILGIGRTFMFHLVGTGEIESCKIGKLRKITSAAIHEYIARLTHEQATAPPTRRLPSSLGGGS